MKNAAIGLGAIIALTATPALAADMEFKVPPPAFSWTGFYIGAQAGGGAFDPGESEDPGVGFLLGGQAGYNYQFGMFVLGVEGEGYWAGMNDRYQYTCSSCSYVDNYTYQNNGDFDIAARAGLAFDRALIYAKGGFAMSNTRYNFNETTTSGAFDTETAAGWVPGLLIGVGLQYALPPAWTPRGSLVVGLEYNYIALNTTTLTATGTCSPGYCTPSTYTYDLDATGTKQIVKLRVDWLFNGPQ